LLAPEYHHSSDSVADGVPALIAKVPRTGQVRADVIKIAATGGVLSKAIRPRRLSFSDEEIRAVSLKLTG